MWENHHGQQEGVSHEALVAGFRAYIQEMRLVHQQLQQAYPPDKRHPFSPAEAISQKLAIEAGSADGDRGEFFAPLRYAWDALTYEGFAAGSNAGELAGAILNQVYNHNRAQGTPEPGVIRLTDPVQVRMLDAMAEAADVPNTPGQAAIQIPEHARNRTEWLLSAEYADRLRAAAARTRGEAPSESWLAPVADPLKPARQEGQSGADDGRAVAEHDPIYQAFWEKLVEEASAVPPLEDPAFWPRRLFEKVEYDIANRDYIADTMRAALARRLVPLAESIRRVRLAYEIAAYPAIKKRPWEEKSSWQELIAADLQLDKRLNNRDFVELTPAEQDIVRRLCETPRYSLSSSGRRTREPHIPFDETRRVYRYGAILAAQEGEGTATG